MRLEWDARVPAALHLRVFRRTQRHECMGVKCCTAGCSVDQLLISSVVRKIISIHSLYSIGKDCIYVEGLPGQCTSPLDARFHTRQQTRAFAR
jgi:hypothetical protein